MFKAYLTVLLALFMAIPAYSFDRIDDEESMIIGGKPSFDNAHKYVFALDGCTAFLVRPRVLMTAAHCISSQTIKRGQKTVRIGNGKNSKSLRKMKYEKVVVHPKYKNNRYFDQAVIIMKKDIQREFDVGVLPNVFWGKPKDWVAFEKNKTQLRAIGYGRAEGRKSGVKRHVVLRLKKFYFDIKLKGKDYLQRWHYKNFSEDSILATTFSLESRKVDTCNGDSGGPIVLEGPTDYYLGLTVAGDKRCGSGKKPSIYRLVTPSICGFKRELAGFFSGNINKYCQ